MFCGKKWIVKKKRWITVLAVLIGIGFAFDRDNEPASNNQLR